MTHGGTSSYHGRGTTSRGRGFNGRGRGRGRGRDKSTVECYKCHRLGHFQNECPTWDEEANYADFDETEEMLLMAYIEEEDEDIDASCEADAEKMLMMHDGKNENIRKRAWFLDSGCSNHMSGDRNLFSQMNEKFKHSVKLGNDKKMEVVGKGNVKLMLNSANYTISDVYYIPELKNNLLSLGQLQEKQLTIIIQRECVRSFMKKEAS